MASIFTFDPNPPRVSSPWLKPENGESDDANHGEVLDVDRLEAEPQDGPIEYKLHLLLRPRRTYAAMSTAVHTSSSQHSKAARHGRSGKTPGASSPSFTQQRQERLQGLTTQLLWRLQQSSPYHAKAKGDLVIPKLPENYDNLEDLVKPRHLLPGLEESNGALYEIGVADDGTLVGLTKDEMDESMSTLKVIAASLGCRVEVQRMKVVGNCEWVEAPSVAKDAIRVETRHLADLWVAEALVMPILEPQRNPADGGDDQNGSALQPTQVASQTEQLRVSLIGPTNSGKTTLLGTLANGTLDNTRGSSRMNLLKHRHERVSGQTSSVAQELIGYKDDSIFNYISTDIDAWTDIHDRSENGRLVFVSDVAGRLRYRRTILRGLVGWAPHWTFLCITAHGGAATNRGPHSLSGTPDDLGDAADSQDLALAHLDLCLRLQVPLVIVITKYDTATKGALKSNLSNVLSRIKSWGRTPKLLMPAQPDGGVLTEVPAVTQQQVARDVIEPLSQAASLLSIVPVVLTSAADGRGTGIVHALLKSLPVPPPPTAREYAPSSLNPEQPSSLFHIDDKYELQNFGAQVPSGADGKAIVVAGYLRFGNLSVGDHVLIGPFPVDDDEARGQMPRDHPSPGYGLSISHPGSSEFARLASRNAVPASSVKGEWHRAIIVNIRNLRLPVRTMGAGQAGTLQVVFDEPGEPADQEIGSAARPGSTKNFSPTIRKGQVLAIPSQHMLDTGLTLQAASGFTVVSGGHRVTNLSVGTLVNGYAATVRAAARILRISRSLPEQDPQKPVGEDDSDDDVFNMASSIELDKTRPEVGVDDTPIEYSVTLELLANREWIELGSPALLMEGGRRDSSGLEGYVGKVMEIAE